MFPENVFEERRRFVAQVSVAPPEFLGDNSAALMRIIGELQASLALELQVIQQIKRLDVDDAQSLADYVARFEDYVDSRGFNLERTSCGRIADIYWNQIHAIDRGHRSTERVDELHQLLQRFADADRQFTEEIEPFMTRSLRTLKSIQDAAAEGRAEDARRMQREYADEYRSEVDRLKAAIDELTEAGRSLVSRL